jgi:hypothetical protein
MYRPFDIPIKLKSQTEAVQDHSKGSKPHQQRGGKAQADHQRSPARLAGVNLFQSVYHQGNLGASVQVIDSHPVEDKERITNP